jgi:transposase
VDFTQAYRKDTLLRRSENLGTEQYFRLRDLLRHNLKTVRAYLLKEAFQ